MQSHHASGSPWGWIVTVALGGLALAGLSMFREGQRAPAAPTSRAVLDEAAIVSKSMELQSGQLPSDTFGLGHVERSLLLKLNGDPQRTFEVAGGLNAIAEKHLALNNPTEAMRVAQVCADLVPNTVTAARCWILCGEASAASQPDLPLSLRYLERADQTLLTRLNESPDQADALKLRGRLLLKLGQAEARFQRTDAAVGHLRELVGDGPLSKLGDDEQRMKALLTLSQLLRQPAPTQSSAQLREEAWTLGTTGNVPPAVALQVLRESIPLPSNPNEDLFAPPAPADFQIPTRTDNLLRLWNSPRFQGLPEWFQVGDELASDSFFHEPPQVADFEIVCRKLLVTMPQTLATLSADSMTKRELESIYASNLLLAVSAARDRGDQSEVTRLTKLFEETFHGRDIAFTAPAERPLQRMHRIGAIYRESMLGHVEQMKQLQASPHVPEPR